MDGFAVSSSRSATASTPRGPRSAFRVEEPTVRITPPPQDNNAGETRPLAQVSLQRVLLDAYEFHGLNQLIWALLLFILATIALYSLWGGLYSNSAAFTSSVTQSFRQNLCGPGFSLLPGQNPINVEQITNMGEAVDYAAGFITCAAQQSKALNLSSANEMRLTQWARVVYIRLLFTEADTFWTNSTARFYPNPLYTYSNTTWAPDPNQAQPNTMLPTCFWARPEQTTQPPGAPSPPPASPPPPPSTGAYSPCGMSASSYNHPTSYVTEVLTTNTTAFPDVCYSQFIAQSIDWPGDFFFENQSLSTSNQANNCLDPASTLFQQFDWKLAGDRQYIAQAANSFKVQIAAENIIGDQEFRAVFALTVQYAVLENNKVVVQISTSQLPPGQMDSITFVWMGLLLALTLWGTITDIRCFHLTWCQRGHVLEYFLYWWNWIVWISQVANWVWILWFFITSSSKADTLSANWPPQSMAQMDAIEDLADNWTTFVVFGIFAIFLVGLRICRFMRVHLGMHALYKVFVDVFNHALDFVVFAIYLLAVLGVITFASFQISGGSELFIDFPDGMSAMARITFGFLSFDEFYNDGIGLNPSYSFTRTFIFWVCVVVLTIYITNTLISIFNDAYARSQMRVLRVQHSFVVLVVYRLFFFFYYYFCLLPRAMLARADDTPAPSSHSDRAITPQWLSRLLTRRMRAYKLVLAKFGEGEELKETPFWQLMARWSIVCLRDVEAITALYTDYATLKLREHPPEWYTLVDMEGNSEDHTAFRVAVNSMLTEGQVDSLINTVLRRRETLTSVATTLGIFTNNPFIWMNRSTSGELRSAITCVYSSVDKPIVDSNNNGIDDALETTKHRLQLVGASAAQWCDMMTEKHHRQRSEMRSAAQRLADIDRSLDNLLAALAATQPPPPSPPTLQLPPPPPPPPPGPAAGGAGNDEDEDDDEDGGEDGDEHGEEEDDPPAGPAGWNPLGASSSRSRA